MKKLAFALSLLIASSSNAEWRSKTIKDPMYEMEYNYSWNYVRSDLLDYWSAYIYCMKYDSPVLLVGSGDYLGRGKTKLFYRFDKEEPRSITGNITQKGNGIRVNDLPNDFIEKMKSSSIVHFRLKQGSFSETISMPLTGSSMAISETLRKCGYDSSKVKN